MALLRVSERGMPVKQCNDALVSLIVRGLVVERNGARTLQRMARAYLSLPKVPHAFWVLLASVCLSLSV